MYALKMAALLVKECAGGVITGDVVDIYPNAVLPAKVKMNFGDFARLIGCEIPRNVVDSILKSLECEVVVNSDEMEISVPTYRVDVTRPCDVIEDVLRIYGYNNVAISEELHACLSFKTAVDAADDLRRTLSEQLTGAGFNEILNNSLTASAYYTDNALFPEEKCIRLLNPLSQELNVLRQTLLYGGLESVAHNINRRSADLAFYEFGNVYRLNPVAESTKEAPLAPYSESARLGLWLSGSTRAANWLRQREDATVYDLKAVVMNILARCGVEVNFRAAEPDQIFTDRLDIQSVKGGTQLGCLGVVSPAVLRKSDIKVPVVFAELDWTALSRLASQAKTVFAPLPKAQAVKRDLSLLIDQTTTMAELETAIRRCEPKLLRKVELFDVYEGDKLPAGKKSYAVSILMQDPEKTLQDKYIDKIMAKITETLRRTFGAELR